MSPQLEGQWLAMVAADGTYSIPPSFADAGGMAGNAKHARANTMAQTITLLELIIKPISLSAWCLVSGLYSGLPELLLIFKSYRYGFVHARILYKAVASKDSNPP